MSKSEASSGLDNIQKSITPAIKGLGFRKTGRTFNRRTTDGLIQVINFQMGQFPIGNYVIKGLRENLYGKFTVNLGVVLPSVRRIENHYEEEKAYHEYDCEIRTRLGHDTWWEIKPPFDPIAAEVMDQIVKIGMPFLNRFSTYADVLRELEGEAKFPFLNDGRKALVAGVIHFDRGNLDEARKAFLRAKTGPTNNIAFPKHVQAVEDECLKGR